VGALVSIIVPTYNRPEYHEHLYHVFSSQVGVPVDLWLYDDSPSPSEFFTRDLGDSRVHYMWSPDRVSIGAKRNYLIRASKGNVIAHFDDDDRYSPEYIATMVATLEAADADLVKLAVWDAQSAYDGSIWRWDTRTSGGTCFAVTGAGPAVKLVNCTRDDTAVESALLGYGFSYVYRRKAWWQAPFDDLTHGEDIAFIRRLGKLGGSIVLIDDAPDLVLHTLHPQSTSRIYPQTLVWAPPGMMVETEDASDLVSDGPIRYRAGRIYRVVALVKDSHLRGETLRRAQTHGEVLSFVDPADGPEPAPDGYRYVTAVIRPIASGSSPRRVPPPFSAADKSAVVSVTVVG